MAYRFGNILHAALYKKAGTAINFAGMVLGKGIKAPVALAQAAPSAGLMAYGMSDMFEESGGGMGEVERGSAQEEARNQNLIYDPKTGNYYTPTGRLVNNRAIKEHAIYNIPREYISKRDSVYHDLNDAEQSTDGRAINELVRSGQGARFANSRDILDNPNMKFRFSPKEREDIDKKRAWNMTQLASQAQTV